MKVFIGTFFAVAAILALCACLVVSQEGFSWWMVSAVILGSAVIAGLEAYFHIDAMKEVEGEAKQKTTTID